MEEKRLGRALAQIALIASGANAERLSEIKENYQRLLNFYFASHTDDPNRDAVYKNLIKETYELIDDVCAEKKSKDMSYNLAFSQFWQENRITEKLKNKAGELLRNDENEVDTCLSVSAITISCIDVFDAEKNYIGGYNSCDTEEGRFIIAVPSNAAYVMSSSSKRSENPLEVYGVYEEN